MAFEKDEPEVPKSSAEVQYTEPEQKASGDPKFEVSEPDAPASDAAVQYGGK